MALQASSLARRNWHRRVAEKSWQSHEKWQKSLAKSPQSAKQLPVKLSSLVSEYTLARKYYIHKFCFRINFPKTYISVTRNYLSGINFQKLHITYSLVIQTITWKQFLGNIFLEDLISVTWIEVIGINFAIIFRWSVIEWGLRQRGIPQQCVRGRAPGATVCSGERAQGLALFDYRKKAFWHVCKPIWISLRFVSMRACVVYGSDARGVPPHGGTPPYNHSTSILTACNFSDILRMANLAEWLASRLETSKMLLAGRMHGASTNSLTILVLRDSPIIG